MLGVLRYKCIIGALYSTLLSSSIHGKLVWGPVKRLYIALFILNTKPVAKVWGRIRDTCLSVHPVLLRPILGEPTPRTHKIPCSLQLSRLLSSWCGRIAPSWIFKAPRCRMLHIFCIVSGFFVTLHLELFGSARFVKLISWMGGLEHKQTIQINTVLSKLQVTFMSLERLMSFNWCPPRG